MFVGFATGMGTIRIQGDNITFAGLESGYKVFRIQGKKILHLSSFEDDLKTVEKLIIKYKDLISDVNQQVHNEDLNAVDYFFQSFVKTKEYDENNLNVQDLHKNYLKLKDKINQSSEMRLPHSNFEEIYLDDGDFYEPMPWDIDYGGDVWPLLAFE